MTTELERLIAEQERREEQYRRKQEDAAKEATRIARGSIRDATAGLGRAEETYGVAETGIESADTGIAESQEGLAWELGEYNKANEAFELMYGSVEKNLSNFYSSLTPTVLAATGLRDSFKAFEKRKQDIQKSFAQRGISSPAQEQMTQDAEREMVERNMQAKQDATLQVAGAQQNFLQIGMQKRQMQEQLGAGVRSARAGVHASRALRQQAVGDVIAGGNLVNAATSNLLGARRDLIGTQTNLGDVYGQSRAIYNQDKNKLFDRSWENPEPIMEPHNYNDPYAKKPNAFLW